MSSPPSDRHESECSGSDTAFCSRSIVESLRRYTSFLRERNKALDALLCTSERMRARLHQDPSPDIDAILVQRERDCARFADVAAKDNRTDAVAFESVRQDADSASGEGGALARSATELQADYDALAQKILLCQSECEAIMRERLQATANALRESVQRRKLDAAYGPAQMELRPPVFLDKQQ